MEMKEEESSWGRPKAISLQIIIIIFTIIKLFINFHEYLDYSITLTIDIIFNFILLIEVILIPFFFHKDMDEDIFVFFMVTLGIGELGNVITGFIISFQLDSKDFIGIYYLILFGRIFLLWGFVVFIGFDVFK